MAIALVAHTAAGSTNATTVSTSAIDTTGANFICVWADGDSPNPQINDSKGNTWSRLAVVSASNPSACYVNYCLNPTVGTGHTFAGGSSAVALFVAAFSGVLAFRTSVSHGVTTSTSTIQAGSITPAVTGEVLIAMVGNFLVGETFTIDSGFTILDQMPGVGSQHYGGAFAWVTAPNTSALNPTWTSSGASATGAAAYLVAFYSLTSAAGATAKSFLF